MTSKYIILWAESQFCYKGLDWMMMLSCYSIVFFFKLWKKAQCNIHLWQVKKFSSHQQWFQTNRLQFCTDTEFFPRRFLLFNRNQGNITTFMAFHRWIFQVGISFFFYQSRFSSEQFWLPTSLLLQGNTCIWYLHRTTVAHEQHKKKLYFSLYFGVIYDQFRWRQLLCDNDK